MIPIGPLMWEHRLIERMIALMRREAARIGDTGKADVAFLDRALDFIRTYADRCHHGKEEDILFRDLSGRPMTEEHQRVMAELLAEHVEARKKVGRLAAARDRYAAGADAAAPDIRAAIEDIAVFYPPHIEKEDKRFFFPCMEYFTKEEQQGMLREFFDFDRKLDHERYGRLVEDYEHGGAGG